MNLVVRQKVEMAWGIGKLVEEHLHENTDANYGKHLLQQLAGDVGISERILEPLKNLDFYSKIFLNE